MMRALAITVSLLLPALALADEATGWDASFPAAAVKAHLPQGLQPVLVARAGAADDALTAAATALINAVKGAGVAQVLDDTDLGDTSNASDAELVGRAAKLGAQLVLVVRLGADPGAGARATVTVHDAQGHVRGTFSALEGQPVEGHAATPAPPRADPQAQARFAREQLGFGTFTEMSMLGATPVEGPFEGSAQRRLSMPEFFEKVGRTDLADRYVTRASVRDALTVGGAAVTILGLVAGGVLLESGSSDCSSGACTSRSNPVGAALAAGGGILVGGGLIAGGLLVDPMPVSDAEARELAREHNARLRNQLGLSMQVGF